MKAINKRAVMMGLVASLTLGTSAASATIIDAWKLNLGSLNGLFLSGGVQIAGATDATDINNVNVNGFSTISQTVVDGVALGQPFTDSGSLQLTTYVSESLPSSPSLDWGTDSNDKQLFGYLEFLGLTGVLNNDGSITFNPGSGTIKLWVENDGDLKSTTGNVLNLATYELLAPSGGSDLDFFGGTAADSTIAVTAKVTSALLPNLFASSTGDPLTLVTLHLVNTNSLLNPDIDPNPDNSGVINGNGTSLIHVQNAGQYNLATVPEPGALSLVGLGLIGLGAMRRRRMTKS